MVSKVGLAEPVSLSSPSALSNLSAFEHETKPSLRSNRSEVVAWAMAEVEACALLVSINDESEAFLLSFRCAELGGDGDLRPECDFWLRRAQISGQGKKKGVVLMERESQECLCAL